MELEFAYKLLSVNTVIILRNWWAKLADLQSEATEDVSIAPENSQLVKSKLPHVRIAGNGLVKLYSPTSGFANFWHCQKLLQISLVNIKTQNVTKTVLWSIHWIYWNQTHKTKYKYLVSVDPMDRSLVCLKLLIQKKLTKNS
jgi:hypothetical protein